MKKNQHSSLMREIHYELFLLPALLGYSLFFIYPVVSSFCYSLTDWTQFSKQIHLTGIANYIRVLGDEELLIGIKNSFIYAMLMTIFQNGLAIPLAVALDHNLKTKNLLRMIYFAPAVLSIMVVGYLWSYIMAPTDYGLINKALIAIGLWKINWLGQSNLALYSIVITQVWQWTGWAMVIYLANLQSIPMEIVECSKIDGANGWQAFWRITLPMLIPSITVNSVLSMIGGLKVFDAIFAMTGGGPGHATETITTVLIKRGFTECEFGYASAIAVTLFIVIAIISSAQLNYLQKWEDKLT